MPGIIVSVAPGPPLENWTSLNDYSGNNLIYQGIGRSIQPLTTFVVASVSKAAAGVVTTTGNHGLTSGQTVLVAGGTADWAGINGIQVVTVISPTTFSIPVNTAGYALTFAGTITTTAPLTTQAIWYIAKNSYNAQNQLIGTFLANGSNGANNIWDNRASLAYS